ncbi:MAG TPA: hypothetical protein VNZ94_14005 [Xanthobacteraceae bacterium]|nr:hypothetical protein [Rhizobiaceae bacterium]HWW48947.1 hypothetical protein [Xanthobacteraceae bacterium]
MRLSRQRLFALVLVGLALAVVMLANAHLLYVATSSQPECMPHAQAGGATSPVTPFSAAKPSC